MTAPPRGVVEATVNPPRRAVSLPRARAIDAVICMRTASLAVLAAEVAVVMISRVIERKSVSTRECVKGFLSCPLFFRFPPVPHVSGQSPQVRVQSNQMQPYTGLRETNKKLPPRLRSRSRSRSARPGEGRGGDA